MTTLTHAIESLRFDPFGVSVAEVFVYDETADDEDSHCVFEVSFECECHTEDWTVEHRYKDIRTFFDDIKILDITKTDQWGDTDYVYDLEFLTEVLFDKCNELF